MYSDSHFRITTDGREDKPLTTPTFAFIVTFSSVRDIRLVRGKFLFFLYMSYKRRDFSNLIK
jgi:hypothetical protein